MGRRRPSASGGSACAARAAPAGSARASATTARQRALRLGLALGLAAACARPLPLPPAEHPLPALPAPRPERAAPPPPCLRVVRIEVAKRDHRLLAFCEHGAVVAMDAALGRAPVGPKAEAADERTPEGEYRIAGPARPSRFHLFIPIDYPGLGDAERALAAGRLSRADYERIAEAHRRGEEPPQDTALGGELGIHGEGERWRGWSGAVDWTLGCVAVSDENIQFLAERVEPGVPVWILP